MEIAGKATRNSLFFYSSTYLSAFCPDLDAESSVSNKVSDKGETSQRKRRRYNSSSQEECGVDDAPLLQETPRQLSLDPLYTPEKVMIPPSAPVAGLQLWIAATEAAPPTSPMSMTTRAKGATPKNGQRNLEKNSDKLATKVVEEQNESVKSCTETGNKNSNS